MSKRVYQNDSGQRKVLIEEVSLVELIGVLMKRKKMIMVILISSIIMGLFITFILINPSYEAAATVRIQIPGQLPDTIHPQIHFQVIDHDSVNELLQRYKCMIAASQLLDEITMISNGSEMTAQDLKLLLTSDNILNEMIRELQFEDANISMDKLRNSVRVEAGDGAGVYRITVRTDHAAEAVKTANFLAGKTENIIDNLEINHEATMQMIQMLTDQAELKMLVYRQPLDTFDGSTASAVTQNEAYRHQVELQFTEELHSSLIILAQQIDWLNLIRAETTDAILISEASSARKVSPRTSLNIATALVAGLLLGLTAAFFAEYWKKRQNS